ncbi:MAG: hypothetical protein RMI45_08850 [Ignisphaera sp.]|nr:hypothetical protein [Ignisphaera sp.]MDW8086325.1 hypothetical protein [Ignisphaera sp.]
MNIPREAFHTTIGHIHSTVVYSFNTIDAKHYRDPCAARDIQ